MIGPAMAAGKQVLDCNAVVVGALEREAAENSFEAVSLGDGLNKSSELASLCQQG